MNYPKVVEEARKVAIHRGTTIIVYQQGRWWRKYGWVEQKGWEYILRTVKRPITKLLICLPSGHVAQ